MIDISQETVLTLPQAAKDELPYNSNGKPVHHATLHRWAARGLRRGGKVVKLEVLKIGGRTYTSREALQRFADELTAADGLVNEPDPPAAIEHVEEELDALGLK